MHFTLRLKLLPKGQEINGEDFLEVNVFLFLSVKVAQACAFVTPRLVQKTKKPKSV